MHNQTYDINDLLLEVDVCRNFRTTRLAISACGVSACTVCRASAAATVTLAAGTVCESSLIVVSRCVC